MKVITAEWDSVNNKYIKSKEVEITELLEMSAMFPSDPFVIDKISIYAFGLVLVFLDKKVKT